jgi:uncharacterized protein (DUF305 family)
LSVVLLAALSACSDEPATPSTADTTFVQDMAMSGSSAMAMADQARTRSKDPDIRALADDVFNQVAPVVDQLAELGPALAADGADGFAHDDSDDHGEMSANRFDDLRIAPDRKFDAIFLKLLREELREGQGTAQAAQMAVTDPRTQALSDRAAATWVELNELVNAR